MLRNTESKVVPPWEKPKRKDGTTIIFLFQFPQPLDLTEGKDDKGYPGRLQRAREKFENVDRGIRQAMMAKIRAARMIKRINVAAAHNRKEWGFHCDACGWLNLGGMEWNRNLYGQLVASNAFSALPFNHGEAVHICLACSQVAAINNLVILHCLECGISKMIKAENVEKNARDKDNVLATSPLRAMVVRQCYRCQLADNSETAVEKAAEALKRANSSLSRRGLE